MRRISGGRASASQFEGVAREVGVSMLRRHPIAWHRALEKGAIVVVFSAAFALALVGARAAFSAEVEVRLRRIRAAQAKRPRAPVVLGIGVAAVLAGLVVGVAVSPADRGRSVAAASATTLTLSAEADARVEQGSAGTNFGTATSLISDLSPLIEGYARFTVTGIAEPVTSAKLRLYVTNGSNNGPALYLADNNWTETGVTWNTRPARTSGVIADQGPIPANVWVEYDVTSTVTGDGTYTFDLGADSSDGTTVSSREATNNPPHLLVVS